MEIESLLKSFKKKPLFDREALTYQTRISLDGIKRIIPHREPFLLIDAITALDPEEGLIACERRVDLEDPIFMGHFPGMPIYPGVLQIEMAGQAGLCLHYFLTNNRVDIGDDAAPVALRATKVLGALYMAPVTPGTDLVILGKKLSFDGYFASMIGQILAGDTVCAVVAGEVVIL